VSLQSGYINTTHSPTTITRTPATEETTLVATEQRISYKLAMLSWHMSALVYLSQHSWACSSTQLRQSLTVSDKGDYV